MAHKSKPNTQQKKTYQPPVVSKYDSLQEITSCSCVADPPSTCGCPKLDEFGSADEDFGAPCQCRFS